MNTFHAAINIFWGEAKYGLILTKRYWLNLAAGTINMLLFLIFIQLGIRSFENGVSGEFLTGKMETLIIGFFVFSIVGTGISSITSHLNDSAATGILEQTMLAPIGIEWVLFFGAFVQFIISLALYLLLLPVSMLLCGHFFPINLSGLIFFTLPLWLSSCGVGLSLGAVTLIYKKTQNFSNLIQFLILALMVLPSYPFNGLSLLPISPQAVVLNKAIAAHHVIAGKWIAYIFIQSAVYFVLGNLIFKEAEKHAKEKGILGQY